MELAYLRLHLVLQGLQPRELFFPPGQPLKIGNDQRAHRGIALRGRVDLLTANVPYIPSSEIELLPPEARLYEPQTALDGGGDGLDLLRRVAAAAPQWLAPGGSLLSEISERQAQPAREILRAAGLGTRVKTSEEMNASVVIATRHGHFTHG